MDDAVEGGAGAATSAGLGEAKKKNDWIDSRSDDARFGSLARRRRRRRRRPRDGRRPPPRAPSDRTVHPHEHHHVHGHALDLRERVLDARERVRAVLRDLDDASMHEVLHGPVVAPRVADFDRERDALRGGGRAGAGGLGRGSGRRDRLCGHLGARGMVCGDARDAAMPG
eukprot:29281-Pelagococcus_subviridis.AAC.15